MKENEIKAMLHLLDDPDEHISNHIFNKLVELGKEAIPFLENEWEVNNDEFLQHKIEQIIHRIQFESVKIELRNWLSGEAQDLFEATLIIAHFYYPTLERKNVEKKLNAIIHDVWLEINDELTPLEKVKVLNHVIFDIHNFEGNMEDFHSVQNSMINHVLDSKKGSPLTLAIIYSLVAQGVNLPIYGINLPEHFVLGYKNTKGNLSFIDENFILFYINPFNKGAIFTRKEIEEYIEQLKIKPIEYYFNPCNNKDIIKRLLNNLILTFKGNADYARLQEITILYELFEMEI